MSRDAAPSPARRRFLAGSAATALIAAMGATSHAAPVVTVDPPSTNTLIFRDYNGTADANISYNPTPAPSQGLANGTSAWTYPGIAGDPKIMYNDGAGAWDHAAYPWARFRFLQSRTTGGPVQYWEQPARGGEGPTMGTAATFREVTRDAPNPVPDGNGYRVDPFAGAQTGDVFTVDYILMDTFETLAPGEWDAVGDKQTWDLVNIAGNWSVTNSILSGTTTNAPNYDAQVVLTSAFDGSRFKYVEIRMSYSGVAPQLFWRQNTNSYSSTRRVDFGAGAGQWHKYLIDFSGETTWTNTMFVRLDPTQGADSTFEIDYIRIRRNAYGVVNRFTGAASTDWNTAANWNMNRVPAHGDRPVVTGRTAVVAIAVPDVRATTIGNGGKVQVTGGGALTVDGDITVGSGGAGSLTVDDAALSWSGLLRAQANNGSVTISGTSPAVTCTRNDGAAGIEIQNGASLNFVMGPTGVSPVTLGGNAVVAIAATSTLTVDGSAYTRGAGTLPLIVHSGYTGAGTFGTVTIAGFGGMTGSVEYAADAVNLVLGYADAVPIANPSFEIDSEAHGYPGYGEITNWSWAGTGNRGVNPHAGGGTPFADNGAIPDRTAVAFIQAQGGISQTLNGLDTNGTYWLQMWYNARTHAQATDPQVRVAFAGAVIMDWTDNAPVGGSNSYHYTNVVFTPAAHSGSLTLSSRNTVGDQTSLFDAICIVRRDAFQHPIRNPGFEASGTPPLPGDVLQNIAGWTKAGSGTSGVNDRTGPFYDNGVNPEGRHVGHVHNAVASISQTIDGLTPGQSYELSYAYNARGFNGQHAHLRTTIGSVTIQDGAVAQAEAAENYTVPFRTTNAVFAASAVSMELKFENTRTGVDCTVLVDNVRLTAIPDEGMLFILR